jgi:hypothetical protein
MIIIKISELLSTCQILFIFTLLLSTYLIQVTLQGRDHYYLQIIDEETEEQRNNYLNCSN